MAVVPAPASRAAAANGGEVGVDGKVRLAGGCQRIDLLVSFQGLERVARFGAVASVVDQERRAAVLGHPRADLSAERGLRGRDFYQGACGLVLQSLAAVRNRRARGPGRR